MTKVKTLFLVAFYIGLTLLLSGCDAAILDPKGLIASSEKSILITSVLLMLIIVVPVLVLTLVFAWRYREQNERVPYTPNWAHNYWIEIICWSVPCAIIVALATITWVSTHKLDPYKPLASETKPITVQAIALEWKWLFIYPEYNIATVNFAQIPVNTPIEFLITAEGPMNSLQIPQLAGQIYAMAGMQTKLHVLANETGDYRGISANFSGKGFSDMKFTVRVTSQEQFLAWVATVRKTTQPLTTTGYQQLVQPSENHPIQYYSALDHHLFEMAMMKYMMPMNMNMAQHEGH